MHNAPLDNGIWERLGNGLHNGFMAITSHTVYLRAQFFQVEQILFDFPELFLISLSEKLYILDVIIVVKYQAKAIFKISPVNQQMHMAFALNGVFGGRFQIKFEEPLKAALAHAAIPDQVPVNLPFHDPFVEPNKQVGFFYPVITENKIVVTVRATVALFAILFTPSLHPLLLANGACQTLFFIKIK